MPGVDHAHARARWTGRTLRVEIEAFLNPETTLAEAVQIGRSVASVLTPAPNYFGRFTASAPAALCIRASRIARAGRAQVEAIATWLTATSATIGPVGNPA